MLRPRNVYFAGVAVLTLASCLHAGFVEALVTAGVGLLAFGFCRSNYE